ncbi:MAG: hypothetical protein K8T20_09275 [Planctomycetes bacterium]|nr:hypothetical protein [Planctomycetota bacterium]
MRRFALAVVRFTPPVLAAGTALSALVNLTVRDRWPVFSMVSYATPPCAMAVVLFVVAGLWLARRAWRPGFAAAGGAVAAVAWWFATSLVLAPPPEGTPPRDLVRGLGWNLERGARGWDGVLDAIRERDPDLGWFVEAADPKPLPGPHWHEALKGYDRRELDGGLVLITKGRIRDARAFVLDGRSRAAECHVTLKGVDLRVLIVDMDGAPWRHRGTAFEALDAAIADGPPGPLLVGGDFNTPRDSTFFDAWRGNLTHSFEAAGRGMDGTWPSAMPFLPIDHCWVNSLLRIRGCRLGTSGASDHRGVEVEFTVGE